jgi:hypothetical protein
MEAIQRPFQQAAVCVAMCAELLCDLSRNSVHGGLRLIELVTTRGN